MQSLSKIDLHESDGDSSDGHHHIKRASHRVSMRTKTKSQKVSEHFSAKHHHEHAVDVQRISKKANSIS
jgi:type IV secretory pathway VirD2 relaxase